ncbi:MAG: helix-turn-helix domain-containing protein [Hyphomonas sp.]|nr:helix-turn-helix domain-containing protein [Hyphomonas sp.]
MDKMDDGKTLHFEFAENAKAQPATAHIGANGTNGTHGAPAKRHKPEKLMRLLSDRNLKLLKMIRTAEPKTLAELSRISGRPKASLTRTLARLSDLGIVVLVKSKGRGKIPKVACDRVRLEVSLLPEDNGPSGNA